MDIRTDFDLEDKVNVRNDTSVIMRAIGVAAYSTGLEIRCGWFASGVYQTAWLYDWQLEKSDV